MGWANINGLMAHVIVGSTCLVKNMEMANLYSVTENIIMGNGRMVYKMDMGHFIVNRVKFCRKVYGDKVYLLEFILIIDLINQNLNICSITIEIYFFHIIRLTCLFSTIVCSIPK